MKGWLTGKSLQAAAYAKYCKFVAISRDHSQVRDKIWRVFLGLTCAIINCYVSFQPKLPHLMMYLLHGIHQGITQNCTQLFAATQNKVSIRIRQARIFVHPPTAITLGCNHLILTEEQAQRDGAQEPTKG